jgi:hypothetical protein
MIEDFFCTHYWESDKMPTVGENGEYEDGVHTQPAAALLIKTGCLCQWAVKKKSMACIMPPVAATVKIPDPFVMQGLMERTRMACTRNQLLHCWTDYSFVFIHLLQWTMKRLHCWTGSLFVFTHCWTDYLFVLSLIAEQTICLCSFTHCRGQWRDCIAE